MINPYEIALIVGISSVILLIVIVVLCLTYSTPKSAVVRPRKASLPPLHWGYKPRQDGGGLQSNPKPPRPPKGSGGGSHVDRRPGESDYERRERWAREGVPPVM